MYFCRASMPLSKNGATGGNCLKHLYYLYNYYTGKINENHTLIKRKQGEYFWGYAIADIYLFFFFLFIYFFIFFFFFFILFFFYFFF